MTYKTVSNAFFQDEYVLQTCELKAVNRKHKLITIHYQINTELPIVAK